MLISCENYALRESTYKWCISSYGWKVKISL
jgi:hypothetical protein